MNAIALVLVACLPHSGECKSVVQRPTPVTQEECNQRAMTLQRVLAGTIDDAGYRPMQVTCLYADEKEDQ